MNDELKKRLAEAGVELVEWARQGGAFVKEQAPLVAQEVLAWEFYSALLGIAGGLFCLVVALVIWKKCGIVDEYGPQPAPFMGFLCALVFGLIAMAVNIPAAVKVKVAPRVVLIEKLGSVFK